MARRQESAREKRRRQIRQDRKLLFEMEASSIETQKAALYRNGITEKDLIREYQKGVEDGRKHAEDYAFHVIYAAILITLIDHRGMDMDEAVEALIDIDHQAVVCIQDSEITEEAYERTGVRLNWDEAIERIEKQSITEK